MLTTTFRFNITQYRNKYFKCTDIKLSNVTLDQLAKKKKNCLQH